MSQRAEGTEAPERARRASGGASDADEGRGRFSARRKQDAVLRLVRGEDLELVSRELGVTAARLSQWREAFLAGGLAALRSRRCEVEHEEVSRLKAKVGELTMDNELLYEKIHRMEAGRPLARGRSRR